jgi:hypothetical protein
MVTTVDEARSLALKAELMLQEKSYTYRRNFGESSQSQPDKGRISSQNSVNKQEKWLKEKEKGKGAATDQKSQNSYSKPIKCFKCNQPGHRSSDCPRRKAITLVEHEEGIEDVLCDPEEDDGADYSEEEDYAQTCVVVKLMLTPKQDEQTQRNKLFRTRCVINSRNFTVIIDSGSQENIIGKSVVEKLKLPVEKHPNPYSIGWIKTVGDIRVTERCKVPFSIGKYHDVVYCDVVDMDACHILFGRPWQYDNDVRHLGKENTYQLLKNGVRLSFNKVLS